MASTAAASAEAASAADAKSAKKGSSKLLLIVGLVVVLVGGGAGAWFAGLLPFGKQAAGGAGEHAEAAVEEEHGGGAAEGGHGAGGAGGVRALDPFLANLADEGGNRYLKTTIQVEFAGTEPPAAFEARMPQIRDAILTLLTSKSFADIRTPAGKETLRDDVIDRLNHVLRAEAVKAVYFTEFIVQ